MDIAYDHIQEENFKESAEDGKSPATEANSTANNLNAEFAEAYKAISSSPWGSRLGGFLASARKQGESYYEGARKEYSAASAQATRGFNDLRQSLASRTRSLSLNTSESPAAAESGSKETAETGGEGSDAKEPPKSAPPVAEAPERPESLPADIVKEAEGMLGRFRSEASKRIKDLERAEDAADEALLKFGSNIRNFLREAVTIAPPPTGEEVLASGTASGADMGHANSALLEHYTGGGNGKSTVLFESKDPEGKRVIHTTRFDAQLHAIHSSPESFTRDPPSGEFEPWAEKNFGDIAAPERTEQIAKDLEKHEELRRAMEKLVPEQVDYTSFWKRYYFLRHVIETEEARRREMLKGAVNEDEEEVAWDEDSDSETPASASAKTPTVPTSSKSLNSSKETLKATGTEGTDEPPRKSNDQNSQPDSDASYDMVSGATSRAPGSPGEEMKKKDKADDDSDEDWE